VLRSVAVSVARRAWVRRLAVSTPGVRDLAWRFVAGEDLAAGLDAIRSLNARGIGGSLNFVGTHVHLAPDAILAGDAAVNALSAIAEGSLDAHVSIKLTQIGLDINEELCRAQLWRVLDAAAALEIFVRIDMEESRYIDSTLRLFEDARWRYGNDRVGIVVQSYLRNRHEDLDRLIQAGSRIRLVKGGYWESATIVHRSRAEIDASFFADIRRVLSGAIDPAIATHDRAAIDETRRLSAEFGIDRAEYEFQMLYGVRSDLQDWLVAERHRVRCYVPYGGDWFAYVLGCIRRLPGGFVRRIQENR
jgi:proline dehydrogenase